MNENAEREAFEKWWTTTYFAKEDAEGKNSANAFVAISAWLARAAAAERECERMNAIASDLQALCDKQALALTPPPEKTQPAAWVLVPREPTEEMLEATTDRSVLGYDDVYRTMIAAAPLPPVQGAAKPVAYRYKATAGGREFWVVNDCHNGLTPGPSNAEPLYTRPALAQAEGHSAPAGVNAVEGDREAFVEQAEALLSLDAKGALVPHGIGGLGRELLEKATRLVSGSPSPKIAEAAGAAREEAAKLIEGMIWDPPYAKRPDSRMALAIAARNVRRGRALTASEQLANLAKAIQDFDEAAGIPDLSKQEG